MTDQILVGVEYARVVSRHLRLAVSVVLIVTAAALVWALITPAQYQATAVLQVSQSKISERDVTLQPSAIRALIENRSVAAGALARIKLDQPPHSLSADRFVREHLVVADVPNSPLFQVTVRMADPRAAAAVANAVAEGAAELNRQLTSSESVALRDFMRAQRAEALEHLKDAEQRLIGFKRSTKVDLQRQEAESLLDQRRELSSLAVDIRAEEARLATLEQRLEREPVLLESPRSPGGDSAIWSVLTRDERSRLQQQQSRASGRWLKEEQPLLMRQERTEIPAEKAEGTAKTTTATHVAGVAERARAGASRSVEVGRPSRDDSRPVTGTMPEAPPAEALAGAQPYVNPVRQVLAYEASASRSRLSALRGRQQELTAALRGGGARVSALDRLYDSETQLRQLQLDYELAEDTYIQLSSQYSQARLRVASRTTELQLVDRAVPPDRPVAPRRLWSVMIGLISGLLAGIVAAFAAEYLSATRQVRPAARV